MFNGFAVLAERFVKVSVLDPPTEIDDGLKLHVAPLVQDKAMEDRKVLGPVAEMENVAAVVPMSKTLERELVESEKTGFPVPTN
jgi:hypothetical protein